MIEQHRLIVVTDIGQVLADGGMDYFRRRRGQYDPTNPSTYGIIYDDFQPIPHSQKGLPNLIKGLGAEFRGYYTVRPRHLGPQAQGWLGRYNYPDPTDVHTCTDHTDKITKVVNDFLIDPSQNNRALLVDDNRAKLVEAAVKILGNKPELKRGMERLMLVGFGGKRDLLGEGVHTETGLRLLVLESWEPTKVEELTKQVQSFR